MRKAKKLHFAAVGNFACPIREGEGIRQHLSKMDVIIDSTKFKNKRSYQYQRFACFVPHEFRELITPSGFSIPEGAIFPQGLVEAARKYYDDKVAYLQEVLIRCVLFGTKKRREAGGIYYYDIDGYFTKNPNEYFIYLSDMIIYIDTINPLNFRAYWEYIK